MMSCYIVPEIVARSMHQLRPPIHGAYVRTPKPLYSFSSLATGRLWRCNVYLCMEFPICRGYSSVAATSNRE